MKKDKEMQKETLEPSQIRNLKRGALKARRRRKRLLTFVIVLLLLLLAAIPGYEMVYQPYQAKTFYRAMKNVYGSVGQGNSRQQ